MVIRGLVGLAFIGAGGYVGYYALHPQNNIALGIAAGLFVLGGLVSDYDDVGNALVKLASIKITLPSKQ